MNRDTLRLATAGVAVVLAVIAIAVDDARLTWLAIALLALTLALRFMGRRPRS